MPYEKYKRASPRAGSPAISIVDDGRIALNAAAARALAAAGVKAVALFWDKEKRMMAMQGVPKGDRDSYAVSIPANLHSGSLRAKNFLGYIGWSATGREMLPAQWDAKKKMLEVLVPAQFVSAAKPKPKPK